MSSERLSTCSFNIRVGSPRKPSLRLHPLRNLSRPSAISLAASNKQAVIIVDHGSRRAESNQQLEKFVTMYRQMYDAQLAVAAHMEIASPSIKEAVAQCAMQGYKQIIIAPYFLSQGRHIQQDIPALVAEAQAEHPDLACIIAEPIGIDKTVADIIHSRVASAMAQKSQ